MAKQTTKAQLLDDIRTEHRRLDRLLASLSPEEMIQPGAVGAWSVKDVLAHLTAWEGIFLGWYRAGLRNETPEPSPAGMRRSIIDALNQRIYAAHQADPLDRVLAGFHTSFQETLAELEAVPEEEMFAPGRFAWTGELLLADYIAGNTCSHYAWARSKLRSWAAGNSMGKKSD